MYQLKQGNSLLAEKSLILLQTVQISFYSMKQNSYHTKQSKYLQHKWNMQDEALLPHVP